MINDNKVQRHKFQGNGQKVGLKGKARTQCMSMDGVANRGVARNLFWGGIKL